MAWSRVNAVEIKKTGWILSGYMLKSEVAD